MGRQKAKASRRESRRNHAETNVVSLGAKFNNKNDAIDEMNMPRVNTRRDESPLEARTENQAAYLKALETKSLIFATGEAGCGKTYLATAWAAKRLLDKEVERIIVTRPVLQADEDLGFLPGDISEKFAPYFRPVYDVLQKRLGHSFLQYCLRPEIGKVEIAPFAYMRGRTFENAVVILDEAQNATAKQMKMFLTRLGENCTVIVNGDVEQIDLPSVAMSGLRDALDRFEDDAIVSVVRFLKGDCVRSVICARALQAYA